MKPTPPPIRIICSCGMELSHQGARCYNCVLRVIMFIFLLLGAGVALSIVMVKTFG